MSDSRQAPHPFAAADRVTVVSGLPRSGTSLLMQVLEAAGLAHARDDARGPDVDNPRGYFELSAVTRMRRDAGFLEACRGCVVKIVAPLVLELPPRYAYRVLFVERDLAEVLASQRAMLERTGARPPTAGDGALSRAFESTLARCRAFLTQTPGIDALFVAHRALLEQPAASVAQIARFLEETGEGIATAEAAETAARARASMARAVDPALYRQRH